MENISQSLQLVELNDLHIALGAKMVPFAGFNGNVSSFEFEVFFHKNFNFVKSGKLPGRKLSLKIL